MVSMATDICVYGAGSVGCYIGGRLAGAGARVVLVGRQRIADEISEHGLRLTDLHGVDQRVAPDDVRMITSPRALTGAGLVLVTVKSAATVAAAAELADILEPGTVVISFQNGLRNADELSRALPDHPVLPGMVQFNIVHHSEGHFHLATSGSLQVREHADLAPYLERFERAGLPLGQQPDLAPVQWAKLMLNLNNAVNALSGLPLREELSVRAFRRCFALALDESIRLTRAAGIEVAKLTPLPPRWLPRLVAAPDPVFLRLAGSMVRIDPHARSSMQDDLDAGRPTEVDELNGEIVRLADRIGERAPINARLVELVRDAETGGRRDWPPGDLYAELSRAEA